MAVDISKMKRDRQEKEGGVEWAPKEGDNLLYIAPPIYDNDEFPYVEVSIHYQITGDRGRWGVCLDTDRNPVMMDNRVQDFLKDRGIAVKKGKHCAVCKKIERENLWDTDKDAAMAIRPQPKFIFNVIPWAHRADATEEWGQIKHDTVRPYLTPKTVWGEICDLFFEEGNLTDPESAILIRILRTGKGIQTRYTIKLDSESLRDHLNIGKAAKAVLRESTKPGSDCDPYFWIASKTIPADELQEIVENGASNADRDADKGKKADKDDDGNPPCFGLDFEAEDKECVKCPVRKKCIPICAEDGNKEAKAALKSMDDGDGDDDKPKKAKSKVEDDDDGDDKPKKRHVEDDNGNGDDDDDKPKKAKPKDEDDDDELAALEKTLAKKSSKNNRD